MRRKLFSGRIIVIGVLAFVIANFAFFPASADGFTHGRVFNVDGEEYYMAGANDAPGGAYDIPGHYWVQAGPNMVVGKHYNTGPFGASSWWSSDAPDGDLLYMVYGIIDTWTTDKAARYAARGFTHYHELIDVETTHEEHPTKVVWLKHTAVSTFNFDGGPPTAPPEWGHEVSPGIDYEFMPNGFMPYNPKILNP